MQRAPSRVAQMKQQYEELSKKKSPIAGAAKEKKKVKELFKKYDTDGSGDIDAKEFQVLAFDLGLVLTDEESKKFVQELDTDGDGTVSFDEFLAWWSNPDKKVVGAENDDKLKLLKLRLRSQSVLAAASSITNTLSKTTETVKKLEEDRSKLGLKVHIGEFGEARSSLSIAHVHSAEDANKIRTAAKADENTLALSFKFSIKEGIDVFEVGEISSSVKGLLSMAKDALKTSSVTTSMVKVDGKDVFALNLALNVPKLDVEQISAVVDTLKVTSFETKIEASERPGDSPNPKGVGVRISSSVSLDRAALQAMGDAFVEDGSKDLAKALLAAAAIRNISLLIESDSVNNFLRDEFYKDAAKLKDANGFSALKTSFILPRLGKLLLNDEIPPVVTDLYKGINKVFEDLLSVEVVAGEHVFKLTLNGLGLFKGYLPTIEELRAFAEEEEKREEKRLEELLASLISLDGGLSD